MDSAIKKSAESYIKNGYAEDVIKQPTFPVETGKKDVLMLTAVTSNTTNTGDTGDTGDTTIENYLPVLPVWCITAMFNSLFGQDIPEQIMKVLFEENRPLTNQILADRLGKKEDGIRQAILRKSEFFSKKGSKGRICHNYLSQVGIDEIIRRISLKKEEIERKEQILEQKQASEKEQKDYIEEIKKLAVETKVERVGKELILDFNNILDFDPDLADKIIDKPNYFIESFLSSFEGKYSLNLKNIPDSTLVSIEEIRNEHVEKLSSIEGRVVSMSSVRPVCVNANFECPSCGTVISVLQAEKKFKEPLRCSCGRRGQFRLVSKKMVNTARIIVEDLQEKTDNPHSERMNCLIQGHLVEPRNIKTFTPGNEIRMVGVLKEIPIQIKNGTISTRFDYIFDILSAELSEHEIDVDSFLEEEVKEITALSAKIDLNGLKEITPSFAPDVHGSEAIKEAVIMQLCNKRNDGGPERNKPNILLIGDPSVAKSVIGKFAISITPGSKKAVGGGSSAVGITASVVKEEAEMGGYRVEPGALVNAKDLLFLDELNNLSDDDKPKLQEGMSEQTVTINKANLHVTMKVRAGILAAANPIHGHFNYSEDLIKQFNITSPILNRFDEVFVIKDIINEDTDKAIAEKMLNRKRKLLNPTYNAEFLRKFFVYIKQQPEPEISKEISDKLSCLYTQIRKHRIGDLVINPRFIEAMTRLIIASAKLRLSDKVEEKDIERALDILKHSHYQTSEYKYFKEHLQNLK